MALFTALETYLFNRAMLREDYLLALFWGFLVVRNLQISYVMGKLTESIKRFTGGKK